MAKNYDLKLPKNVIDSFDNVAELLSEKQLLDILKSLMQSLAGLKFSTNDKVFVQTAILSLFYNDNLEIELLKQRIAKLESGGAISVVATQSQNQIQPQNNQNVQQNQQTLMDEQKKNSKLSEENNFSNLFDTNSQLGVNFSQGANPNQIVGEIISFARQSGEMLLYAGLSDLMSASIENNQFVFLSKTESLKKLIDEHKEMLAKFLKDRYNLNGFVTKIYVDQTKEKIKKLSQLLDGKLEVVDK